MRKIINKLKKSQKKLLLGFSGGVDSRVLFDLCLRAEVDFGVVHLNHNLRAEAKQDADFVANLCEKNNVPCFIISAPVGDFAKEWKSGLEDAGRRIRRTIFSQIAQNDGYDFVLLAHHEDDQIETILLNLKRGCGVHGLVGMREISDIFWRPMLNVSRQDILDFADKNNLEWREDHTNKSRLFLRNNIRHELLPELEKDDSEFRENLLKISENALKISEINQKKVQEFLGKEEFLRDDFLDFDEEMQGEILRGLWIKLHGDIEGFERVRANEIRRLIQRNIGRKKVKFGDFWVELLRGKVYFSKV